MDKTILGILIGSFTTLLGVALSSLFNYLTKRKELRHNEYLKELELKDRAKERKFKVEGRMIERSIEAHKNAWSLVIRLLGFATEYMPAGEDKPIPEPDRSEFIRLLDEWREFSSTEGFFLEKRICEQIEAIGLLVIARLTPKGEPDLVKLNISSQVLKAADCLRAALERILEEYNPLHRLDIDLDEFTTSGKQGK